MTHCFLLSLLNGVIQIFVDIANDVATHTHARARGRTLYIFIVDNHF